MNLKREVVAAAESPRVLLGRLVVLRCLGHDRISVPLGMRDFMGRRRTQRELRICYTFLSSVGASDGQRKRQNTFIMKRANVKQVDLLKEPLETAKWPEFG